VVRGGQSQPGDLDVAIAAVRAAVQAATQAREEPLNPRAKSVAADLVTEADGRAERAAAAVIKAHRPDDGILGEEGTRSAGERRWLIDAIDGTVAFASGLPGWCAAVALTHGDATSVAAVLDGTTNELHTAAAQDGPGDTIRRGRDLQHAHVATFFRQDRLVLPGVRDTARALLDRAGLIRHAGPGSLELAWIAQGRLDAWVQPNADPWDWLPGALLVTQAGGEARVIDTTPTPWYLAGAPELLDELQRLLR